MGTRTKGEFQKFAKVNANKEEAKILMKYLQNHETSERVVNALLRLFLASNPHLVLLEVSTKTAVPIYNGLKEYKKSGSVKKALQATGKIVGESYLPELITSREISSAVQIIVPAIMTVPRDGTAAAYYTKIIETAATVAGEL